MFSFVIFVFTLNKKRLWTSTKQNLILYKQTILWYQTEQREIDHKYIQYDTMVNYGKKYNIPIKLEYYKK